MIFTTEFHTLGLPDPKGARPPAPPPPVKMPQADYKAVVLLFLAGGADTFQMLIPVGNSLYQEYMKTRKGIDMKEKDLLPIKAASQPACKTFGVHPKMPFLHSLYQSGEAAFVTNIGALVEPTTRSTLKTVKRCSGTFSHSHAQNAAQTMKCQDHGGGASSRGLGGRIADVLSKSHTTASFSIAGTSVWSEGFDTSTEIIDLRQGALRFKEFGKWADTISNITGQVHGNVFCEEYAQLFAKAINSSETLGELLDKAPKGYNAGTDILSQQLKQVARLISTRASRKAGRDFFFVQFGGFDTHSNIKTILPQKFEAIDKSLKSFVKEMKDQGVWNSVTLVTESDFGRTLTFNGAGTDHGWGGQHFIIGGGINGGDVYNDFPETLIPGGEYFDGGRARLIPKYPWESMLVPVAEWMGIQQPESVFPNLGNFNRSQFIIETKTLFK